MAESYFVYVTTPTQELAEDISSILVQKRLIACANILPEMTAIYEWQDELKKEKECVVILKTTDRHLEQLTEEVKALHSSDCPCIVAFRVEGGNQAFHKWIQLTTTHTDL